MLVNKRIFVSATFGFPVETCHSDRKIESIEDLWDRVEQMLLDPLPCHETALTFECINRLK